jgi:hypothetical protein
MVRFWAWRGKGTGHKTCSLWCGKIKSSSLPATNRAGIKLESTFLIGLMSRMLKPAVFFTEPFIFAQCSSNFAVQKS